MLVISHSLPTILFKDDERKIKYPTGEGRKHSQCVSLPSILWPLVFWVWLLQYLGISTFPSLSSIPPIHRSAKSTILRHALLIISTVIAIKTAIEWVSLIVMAIGLHLRISALRVYVAKNSWISIKTGRRMCPFSRRVNIRNNRIA